MKDRLPCGCQRPRPPCDCIPNAAPPAHGCFLMQKILGSAKIHHRRKCYPVKWNCPPVSGTLTLTEVSLCGSPSWEEIPCHERNVRLLHIRIPIILHFRDSCGCMHQSSSEIEEQLLLPLCCQPCDAWRGQMLIQAAVRLCGSICIQPDCFCEVPLELILCAYLVAPCACGTPASPPCPPPKPWYPQPHFDSYQGFFPEKY